MIASLEVGRGMTGRLQRVLVAPCACLLSIYLVGVYLPKKVDLELQRSAQRQTTLIEQQRQDTRPQISLRTTGKTLSKPWDLGGKYPNQAHLCQDWANAEAQNYTVKSIVVVGKGTTDKDGLCSPGRAGNMLLALLSVLMMAYNADVGYEFEPKCERRADGSVGIAAYLPQNVSRYSGRWVQREEERQRTHERMCINPADPLPSTKAGYRWTQFASFWKEDLRNGLSMWATDAGKPEMPPKTAAIHIRCGDILSAPLTEAQLHGFGTLSFHLKHLAEAEVERIDILTPAFTCNADARPEDCENGQACSEIVHALRKALIDKLSFDADAVQIKDGESDLWTMHHIVFSDIIICSPITSFCGVVSIASKQAVHQYAPWANALSKSWGPIVREGELDNVHVEETEYLSVAEIRANGMTAGDIAEHILSN